MAVSKWSQTTPYLFFNSLVFLQGAILFGMWVFGLAMHLGRLHC